MPTKRVFLAAFAAFAIVLLPQCKTSGERGDAMLRSADAALPVSTAHHAWLEIDAQAFEDNIRTLQAMIGGATRICAVMKADAYGHSVELLAPSVVAAGLPCVAITSNDEARLVRAAGFKKQIVRIRTATVDEIVEGLPLGIEETLGNLALAQAAAARVRDKGGRLAVHLALNSGGMSRHGLEMTTDEGRQHALAIVQLPELSVVGITTHFAVEDKDEVLKGLAAFQKEAAWIIDSSKLDRGHVTLHCANSFATLEVPESRLDMVRPGGALYGDTVPSYTQFKRVMQFKSRVAAVNTYPAGNTVSYDRTFVLQRPSRLANVPVGYSDGYRRAFSNKTFVLIRGKRHPIVGRVTMNSVMVDVTDAPEVQAGDEVVLFGKQGADEITQAELEKSADTILADLYTMWGASNPRVLRRAGRE